MPHDEHKKAVRDIQVFRVSACKFSGEIGSGNALGLREKLAYRVCYESRFCPTANPAGIKTKQDSQYQQSQKCPDVSPMLRTIADLDRSIASLERSTVYLTPNQFPEPIVFLEIAESAFCLSILAIFGIKFHRLLQVL